MKDKKLIREEYYLLRKNKYYEIDKDFFIPFIETIKPIFKKKKIKLALYYPSLFELNVIKSLEMKYISNQNILLPVIKENNLMNFFPWSKNEVLIINKFGMLEPVKSKINTPNVMMVPLLVFDKDKYRIGYGKGFYDRYLNRYLKKFKNILTVGVAFSFQKHHKLPINNKDVKLDYILTEKGIY